MWSFCSRNFSRKHFDFSTYFVEGRDFSLAHAQ
jgi:hypothetical protein